MTPAQLARLEAMAHNPSRDDEQREALIALLEERRALRDVLKNLLPLAQWGNRSAWKRAKAALGGEE